jgi:FkbH-like protein
MPEVECVAVPEDPSLRPTCLDRIHSLERAVITAEDLARTRQYQDNAKRSSERRQFADLRGYLMSLGTRVSIRIADADMLARTQQLFAKTNQFNLTTRRYTAGEIEALARDPAAAIVMAHAEDRFGDIGWIGAVVVRGLGGEEASIEAFVLSCRAMGRAVETVLLDYVRQLCFEWPACRYIVAEFLPTAKNAPVIEFYEEHGFEVVAMLERGGKRYRLGRDDSRPAKCDWLTVEARSPRADRGLRQV